MVYADKVMSSKPIRTAKWLKPNDRLSGRLLEELLTETFEQWPPDMFLPVSFSYKNSDGVFGESVDDPLLVYVGLPLTESEANNVWWQLSLKTMVLDFIQMIPPKIAPEHEAGVKIAHFLADSLRNLAATIDTAIGDKP